MKTIVTGGRCQGKTLYVDEAMADAEATGITVVRIEKGTVMATVPFVSYSSQDIDRIITRLMWQMNEDFVRFFCFVPALYTPPEPKLPRKALSSIVWLDLTNI